MSLMRGSLMRRNWPKLASLGSKNLILQIVSVPRVISFIIYIHSQVRQLRNCISLLKKGAGLKKKVFAPSDNAFPFRVDPFSEGIRCTVKQTKVVCLSGSDAKNLPSVWSPKIVLCIQKYRRFCQVSSPVTSY